MATSIRPARKPASLTLQVMHAERQVRERRRGVTMRASTLGRDLRKKMAFPAMLVLAGGLGWAAGRLIKGRASAAPKAQGPRGADNKLFATVLKLIALGRALSSAFLLAQDSRRSPF